jgi:hypothetical protein
VLDFFVGRAASGSSVALHALTTVINGEGFIVDVACRSSLIGSGEDAPSNELYGIGGVGSGRSSGATSKTSPLWPVKRNGII